MCSSIFDAIIDFEICGFTKKDENPSILRKKYFFLKKKMHSLYTKGYIQYGKKKKILAEVTLRKFHLSSKYPKTNFSLKKEKDLSFIITKG